MVHLGIRRHAERKKTMSMVSLHLCSIGGGGWVAECSRLCSTVATKQATNCWTYTYIYSS